MNRKPLMLLTVLCSLVWCDGPLVRANPTTQLEIAVADVGGQLLPCRIHLIDRRGNAQKVAGQPFWHDHFVCSGRGTASLAPGKYDYAIERGPEYLRKTGQIEITAGQDRKLNVKLERIVELRAAAWYSGDLHVHRPVDEIEQLMRAEDLDFAPAITWWNTRNLWKEKTIPKQVARRFDGHRIYTIMAGEDEREGGALLFFGLKSPLDIETDDREFPSPMQFVAEARARNREVWIDIEKPFWWDVPVWLASGQMNSIGIANNHMCRSQMYPSEAWGKPRDAKRLPEPRGNGFWTQEIYYHMLNCGLRLPPSAGSASGVLPNPVGYNRVYVHLDEPFTRDAWFRGLSRGRCFVTNGPLLLVTADGRDPGAAIKLQSGESRLLRINIQLTSQDPVSQVELIRNGNVSHTIQCSDALTQRHTFEFSVDEPCWFLVRAIADVENTFRFAATAPWFVQVGDVEHRISRRSVQFFLDWVDERIERLKANIKNDAEREQVLDWHARAREFWIDRLKMASAE
ncbi:MAG: CehA/McbA family metallohydrolase [Pirellulales bacterium]